MVLKISQKNYNKSKKQQIEFAAFFYKHVTLKATIFGSNYLTVSMCAIKSNTLLE